MGDYGGKFNFHLTNCFV